MDTGNTRRSNEKIMANYLEYILSLKDKITPGLKRVGTFAIDAKNKMTAIEQKAGVGVTTAFQKVGNAAVAMRNKVSASLANIRTKVEETKVSAGGLNTTLSMMKGMLLMGGVTAGIMAIGGMFSTGKQEAENYNLSMAQVKASLESTGGAAGVSLGQITDGMDKMFRSSNYNEAEILQMQSVLLTFTNIGKDAFDQTSQAALDMSQKLGQDVKSSAIQLGKALQDPIQGVTALRRVGVNFSKEQTEVIKRMVETGRQADAQVMILAELNREFGGSAKAAFDANPLSDYQKEMDILRKRLGDMVIAVQTKLDPIFTKVGKALLDMLDAIGRGFSWVWQKIEQGNPIMILLVSVITGVVGAMILMKTWSLLVSAATSIWTGAQWLLNVALSANPIGIVIALIVALIAAIGYVVYKTDGWGKMWDYTVKGMGQLWEGFVLSFTVQWLNAENIILTGIEKLKIFWFSLKKLWDADGANAALNEIAAKQNERAENLKNKTEKMLGSFAAGAQNIQKGFDSLSWNNKSFGVEDVINAIGISSPALPGQPPVKTSFGDTDKETGNGKSGGKSSESVATGGQKNVTVNISYGNAVGTFNLTTATLKESVDNIKDLIIDTITRGVAQGASLGAV